MITKMKNYLKLRKLRRDALTLLIINGADISSELKQAIDFIHALLGNPSEIGKKLSDDNRDAIIKFMNEISAAPGFKNNMNEKIHDDSQKLRNEKATE